MTCREAIAFLLDYLEGMLPAAQRARFEEHLHECPDCVGYLETYEATIRLGRAAGEEIEDAVPEELVRAILAARGASSK